MICDTFWSEVEYAYKTRATLHKDENVDVDSLTYLPMKLREFCDKTGCKPKDVFKRSRKNEYVMLRVAFYNYLPKGFSLVRVGRFLNYNHATVIHWRDVLHGQFMRTYEYREMIQKL